MNIEMAEGSGGERVEPQRTALTARPAHEALVDLDTRIGEAYWGAEDAFLGTSLDSVRQDVFDIFAEGSHPGGDAPGIVYRSRR